MDFEEYFKKKDLKKIPHKGIHYEQKTTPDLIWCVAHVILDITKDDKAKVFSDTVDVRKSPLFNSLMQDYFSKPPQEQAENEYNKVSSYQLGLLTFVGVLDQVDERPRKYKVKNFKVLEYLAINDLNASKFLGEYTEKFLQDNGLWNVFDNYRKNPHQDNHLKAKEAYWNWAKINTAVRGSNRRHTYRVFNKIFNIFCYKNRLPGEEASNITGGPCPYSFLIYNRSNFRDKDMPSGMTRQQYQKETLTEIENGGIVETFLHKVKEILKQKYNYDSEIKDSRWGYAPERVVEAHHILPSHSYQQFSLSRENLIVLTPDQHRSFAHQGSYKTTNASFQLVCLRVKLDHIEESINSGENFYNVDIFISIINTRYNLKIEKSASIEKIREVLVNQKVD